MVHTFTWKEHEDCGHWGWVLDRKPYFDPGNGGLVAHDVFEEMPHGGEQPHDELLAMGALLYGRGSMSDSFNYKSVAEVVAYEFMPCFEHAFNESGYELHDAPKTRKLSWEYESIEGILSDIAEHVCKQLDTDAESNYGWNDEQIEEAKAWVPHGINWLRIGYRRAHRRFSAHLDGYDVTMLFRRLKKQVDELSKGLGEESYKLRVRVSYRRQDVQAWVIPPWNYPMRECDDTNPRPRTFESGAFVIYDQSKRTGISSTTRTKQKRTVYLLRIPITSTIHILEGAIQRRV